MNATERGIAAHRLLSDIRNARYETVWMHVKELLHQPSIWQSYAMGNGRIYEFRPREFDWFLAESAPDLDGLIRDAMTRAPADVERAYVEACGKGAPQPTPEQRRPDDDLTREYPDAAKRVHHVEPTKRQVERIADPKRRSREVRSGTQRFQVRATNRGLADAIVEKLLNDPDLAHQVFRGLNSWQLKKRRSDA